MDPNSNDIESVLGFWFGGDGNRNIAATAQAKEALWWGGNRETDGLIRQRFGDLHAQALRGDLDAWCDTPRGRLALIIVVDQFSRNIHRGTPGAFAQDALARRLCVEGLAAGIDQELGLLERVFFYLPLEHSEDRADQARSVAVYESLTQAAPDALRDLFELYGQFAVDHRRVVDRFGRFPHRNAILGRASTSEEAAFLEQPGSSF